MKTQRDPNRKPTHPGAVLREDVLPELGWTRGAKRPEAGHLQVH